MFYDTVRECLFSNISFIYGICAINGSFKCTAQIIKNI